MTHHGNIIIIITTTLSFRHFTLQFIRILRSVKKARSQCDFNSSHFLLSAKNPLCYWSRVRCSRGLQRSALLTALAGGDYPTIQRHGHQPHASARTVTLTRVWSLACFTVPHQTQLPSGPEGHWPQLPRPWPLNWFLLQNKACFIQRCSHSIKVMPWHRCLSYEALRENSASQIKSHENSRFQGFSRLYCIPKLH